MSTEPMPQTGGSYTRDPKTGEPIKTPDPQPQPAAKPEKPSKE